MGERNEIVDVVRGVAMLLVVLGHTITGTVLGASDSVLFRVIWTLQMPLFFIVSGYITRYSRPMTTGASLWAFIKKRACAYLIPWAIWTIGVRGFILNQGNFLNIRYLLWHMDTGYWFLASLWTIVMINGIAEWLSNKCKGLLRLNHIVLHIIFISLGMGLLIGFGRLVGIGFMSIKLTLYYFPLFVSGYIYGQLQQSVLKWERTQDALMLTFATASGVWLYMIMRYDFYNVEITAGVIVLRYLASIAGCIAIVGALWTVCRERDFKKDLKYLVWAGKNSLAIYLVHYIFLPIGFLSSQLVGMGALTIPLILLKYILVVIFTTVTIRLLDSNRVMRKLLFWK